ncbi:thermonuclease family protein [Sinanaerobacter sp. ZZT-01]|uniref:thermonuclease family protein n=1 Tax=Sinanaerobacter sp. ZZT-01 TaxID=3111540 RepID=UPI002D7A0B66|nr:thermonuclease family protein [Sinanaerobacter sp. ZZT-01]WRR93396.1 thermonuclease family protein [Sinanaerobacter sp. ZZT-01]
MRIKRQVKKKITLILCILIVLITGKFVSGENVTKLEDEYTGNRILCDVIRVVDGDTFVATIDDKEEKVRLIGVDTPESVHPDKSKNTKAGELASEYVKDLLEDQTVQLEFDVQERDKYGRVLAYVYLEDGTFLNEKLILDGYAQIATYPPNVKYVDVFKQAAERRNQK